VTPLNRRQARVRWPGGTAGAVGPRSVLGTPCDDVAQSGLCAEFERGPGTAPRPHRV